MAECATKAASPLSEYSSILNPQTGVYAYGGFERVVIPRHFAPGWNQKCRRGGCIQGFLG